jgi:hypothetical protein
MMVSPGLIGTNRAVLEPAAAFVRNHAAVRPHDVDPALVGVPRGAAAQGDVAVAGQPRTVEVRSGVLDLTDHRDLLLKPRHEQWSPLRRPTSVSDPGRDCMTRGRSITSRPMALAMRN